MRLAWAIVCALACGCGRFGFQDPEGDIAVAYPSPDIDAVLGKTEVMLAPTVTGGPARFTVEPVLPAGLAIDPDTGVVAGTPMELADGTMHTVTAAGDGGTVKIKLRITALPGFVVDATADTNDDDGVDDVCRSSAGGGCTLRAALQTANLRTEKQLILLDASTYALESTLGELLNDIVIAGRGAEKTTIRSATIHGGFGMISILGKNILTLKRATFRDFGPTDGSVVAVRDGKLFVDSASFTNNLSAGDAGAILVLDGSTAVLDRSTFTANASGWGGVIHGAGTGTTILVRQCTASENTAAWGSFAHISSGTSLTLENSTLYKNRSMRAGTLASPGGNYTLLNSTIVHNTNTDPESAGIFLYSAPAMYTVANTIVAFNRDGSARENNCNHRTADTVVRSMGGNLLSDGGGNCAAEFTADGDRLAVDPGIDLNGLADNGGPTRTILLKADSIAIDGAKGTGCPTEDQRGVARPDAPERCDIGAVELP